MDKTQVGSGPSGFGNVLSSLYTRARPIVKKAVHETLKQIVDKHKSHEKTTKKRKITHEKKRKSVTSKKRKKHVSSKNPMSQPTVGKVKTKKANSKVHKKHKNLQGNKKTKIPDIF